MLFGPIQMHHQPNASVLNTQLITDHNSIADYCVDNLTATFNVTVPAHIYYCNRQIKQELLSESDFNPSSPTQLSQNSHLPLFPNHKSLSLSHSYDSNRFIGTTANSMYSVKVLLCFNFYCYFNQLDSLKFIIIHAKCQLKCVFNCFSISDLESGSGLARSSRRRSLW